MKQRFPPALSPARHIRSPVEPGVEGAWSSLAGRSWSSGLSEVGLGVLAHCHFRDWETKAGIWTYLGDSGQRIRQAEDMERSGNQEAMGKLGGLGVRSKEEGC